MAPGWTNVQWRGSAIAPTLGYDAVPRALHEETDSTMKIRRICAALAATAALGLVAPAAGHAGPLVQSAGNCPTVTLEQPFLRWNDFNLYRLVSGGGFELGMPAWTLSKAKIVAGNESFYVRSTKDMRSLSLPAGSSATSQTTCVGIHDPSFRFFARASAVSTSSRLSVEVLFENSLGQVLSVATASIPASSTKWAPTPIFLIAANMLALLPGEQTPVQLRFKPVGTASWWIDDVYVDPKRR